MQGGISMREKFQREEEKAARANFAIYHWFVGGLLVLLILGVTVAPKPDQVPAELQGVWKTNDPRYSDRSLEISSVHLNLGTGEGTSTTGFIRHVKIESAGAESLVIITYTNSDGENTLYLLYDATAQVIHFKNQPGVAWTKESSS